MMFRRPSTITPDFILSIQRHDRNKRFLFLNDQCTKSVSCEIDSYIEGRKAHYKIYFATIRRSRKLLFLNAIFSHHVERLLPPIFPSVIIRCEFFNDQKTGSTNSLIYMVAKSCRNILYKYRSKLQLKALTTFICKIYFSICWAGDCLWYYIMSLGRLLYIKRSLFVPAAEILE
jgi:hypothetical protein